MDASQGSLAHGLSNAALEGGSGLTIGIRELWPVPWHLTCRLLSFPCSISLSLESSDVGISNVSLSYQSRLS